MKHTLTDANFPRTADGRVYHLGIRAGEVANRIITVGSPSRAHVVASHFDPSPTPFTLTSERGFLTITGRYAGVPVSVCSIGMGAPNMDFMVRELRECLTGDMLVVRLGSCGALAPELPVGSVVLPTECVAVTRNYDFDFGNWTETADQEPYHISRPAAADPDLHASIRTALEVAKPRDWKNPIVDVINASADSFYSSQGRHTSFPDHNADLLEHLHESVPGLASLEMETHHLYHLARSWPRSARATSSANPATLPSPPPPTAGPIPSGGLHLSTGLTPTSASLPPLSPAPLSPIPIRPAGPSELIPNAGEPPHSASNTQGEEKGSEPFSEREAGPPLPRSPAPNQASFALPPAPARKFARSPAGRLGISLQTQATQSRIRAAAAQMVFAQRDGNGFVTPDQVDVLERWTAKGVLDGIVRAHIEPDRSHPESGSVWQMHAV